MGVPELTDDPRFSTPEGRRANQQELLGVVGEWAATKPKEEIYHTLQGLRTITGYVATVEDLLASRQFAHREFFRMVEDSELGDVVHPGAPFRIDDTIWQLSRAPRLGEHNEEVLGGRLGLSPEELTQLFSGGRA
jgi:crotonobetainyl-CoA:carnitine CoA-transferase CaiB-like acyl-CoA transferase